MSETVYERAFTLLGKRANHPDVLAFLREQGMGEPPVCMTTCLLMQSEHPTDGFTLDYTSDVQLPQMQPPRREGGQYVAYVTSLGFKKTYAGTFAGGATMKLSRDEAVARALAVDENPTRDVITLDRKNGCSMHMSYRKKDGLLVSANLRLDQRAKDDPEVVAARAKRTPAAPRNIPADVGPAATAPMPELLKKLAAIRNDEGFGEDVDLELYADFQTGGPKGWTGNAAAESQFRVFGGDGSGGLLAFWLVLAGKPLEEQPIVFLESEGGLGVVAKSLADFAVELADGVGPFEHVSYGRTHAMPIASLRSIADEASGVLGRKAVDAFLEANVLYPDFEDHVRGMCVT